MDGNSTSKRSYIHMNHGVDRLEQGYFHTLVAENSDWVRIPSDDLDGMKTP